MAHEIVIPRLGWSMEEGTFVGWLKHDGDLVRRGEAVFELEGEKASQEIEAVDEGILRIPATAPRPGSVLKVGTVIGFLVAADEPTPDTAPPPTSPAPDRAQTALPPAAAPSVRRLARELDVDLSLVDGTGSGGRILSADVERVGTARARGVPVKESKRAVIASPRAKRIARELAIDWTQLSGTGAGGRIRESDVRAAAARQMSPTSAASQSQRIPLTSRRRVIAQRMVASRQHTVPVTLTTRVDAANLVNLRDQYKSMGGAALIPSYQDIITKLVAEVLKRHLLLAGRWDENAIVLPGENELHLGIAVDTDDGLLVPVLRNVGGMSLAQVATQSRGLIERARAGTLVAADMQGGVFTITNLGAFGIDAFTPVINAPEAAILGLGAIRHEPVVRDDGQIVARSQMTLSLTFDHRLIDGAPAARFLQSLVSAVANPSPWLLGE
jgi:pyruvate dehydrogenase E2 component (dihydrolipoamide acetyltransferase)